MKRILLISGSLRSSSINTAVLRTAAQGPASDVVGCLYDRLELLPAFNPDRDRDPMEREVRFLRDEIHEAGALLFSTPEYAGALPGALKNLLDWTIGDDQVGSIYGNQSDGSTRPPEAQLERTANCERCSATPMPQSSSAPSFFCR
jgi:chromate reductase, NAD(P)H dehydrogenase (quinone)